MWYGKTRVTSYELKALKHELKSKSASSNPRVTSSNPWVTSSNPWLTSSNPWVTSSNLRVTSSNPRIIKSMKTRVNSLKISSFPKIINPKLFGWLSKWKKRPNFPQKSHPDISFLSLTQNFMLCLFIKTARHWKFLHIVSTVAYQIMAAHQCPLYLPSFLLDI